MNNPTFIDKTAVIAATAIIPAGAKIGPGVVIEPYAVIASPHVIIEEGVCIKSHAYIDGYTTIGAGSVIYPFASIGTKPQDLKYKGEKTEVKIGKRCEIREYVTINSSCGEGTSVILGDDCLIMASCHIAHNCILGNRVIMSNGASLAGHVEIEDYAIISGMTGVHQFVRIGTHAMIGGMSRITRDIPPYTIGAGADPYVFAGINRVGLQRHGFSLETRQMLSKAFKYLYRSSLPFTEALNKIESELAAYPEVVHFVNFCRRSNRGIMGVYQQAALQQEDERESDHESKAEIAISSMK